MLIRLRLHPQDTALIPAAHHGHVETVRELLKTKIDVNHVNRLGWTALLEAIILGDGGAAHTEIVRLLMAHGVKLQLAGAQGVTPLAHAGQRAAGDCPDPAPRRRAEMKLWPLDAATPVRQADR